MQQTIEDIQETVYALERAQHELSERIVQMQVAHRERAKLMAISFKRLIDLHDKGEVISLRTMLCDMLEFYTAMGMGKQL